VRNVNRRRFIWVLPMLVAFGLAFPASVFADAPVAQDLPSETTPEDAPVTITLTATDTESDPLTFTIVSPPSHGSLSNTQLPDCSGAPTCTEDVDYSPDANYNGSDSFTYTATDGSLDSNIATVTISITAVNDAPVAAAKPSETTQEDTPHSITMSGTDVDGDALTFSASSPTHGGLTNFGTASCNALTPSSCTETVDYTPSANYSGGDSFTYKVNDGTADSSSAIVTISITAVNDPPTADAKPSVSTAEDTLHTITLSGGDTEGSALTFAIVSPTHGSLSNVGTAQCSGTPSTCTQTVDYTPAANYNGPDSFTYRTNDGTTSSASALVSISVSSVNDTPSFTKGANQSVLTDSPARSISSWATAISTGPTNESGQTPTFHVTADDNAALFSVVPAIASNGTLTYTIAGTTGVAHLTIDVQDDGGTTGCVSISCDTSATQSFTITVMNLVAHNDGATIPQGAPATAINVLANDNPGANPSVSLTISGFPLPPAHGTVLGTGGTTNAWTGLTYQPAAAFQGSDSFSYTISDGTLTAQATVVITVSEDVTGPSDNPPVESIRTGVAISSTGVQVHVAWSATDAGVGVGRYLLQRATDGGAYTTVTLPTATTTSINITLGVGHKYQFRMRAYDKNGNGGALKYGPQFQVSRIEDSSSLLKFSATVWHVVSNASDSGGSAHYTYAKSATATMTLSGRDYAIVVPKNSFRGTASISVDGVFNASISEHTTSSTTSYRQVIWSIHFATAGTHVIQITTTSTSRFDLDAFVALR
jgi:hypothetical protein